MSDALREKFDRVRKRFLELHDEVTECQEIIDRQGVELSRLESENSDLKQNLHDADDGDTWREACGRCEKRIKDLESENAKLQSNYDSCTPYLAMADRIVEACIEATNYDELFVRCMEALDDAKPETRSALEDERVRKIQKEGGEA